MSAKWIDRFRCRAPALLRNDTRQFSLHSRAMSEHDKTYADLDEAATRLGSLHPEWTVLPSQPSGTEIRIKDRPNVRFMLVVVGEGMVEAQWFPDLSHSHQGKTVETISGYSSPRELATGIGKVCRRALGPTSA